MDVVEFFVNHSLPPNGPTNGRKKNTKQNPHPQRTLRASHLTDVGTVVFHGGFRWSSSKGSNKRASSNGWSVWESKKQNELGGWTQPIVKQKNYQIGSSPQKTGINT